MAFLHLFPAYLLWHYTSAWRDLLRLYLNFSWFLCNFLSVRLLVTTLFAPWKRLRERGRAEGGLAGRIILNTTTRMAGFLVRAVTILLGLLSLVSLTILFFFVVTLWAAMPFMLLAVFLVSLRGLLEAL